MVKNRRTLLNGENGKNRERIKVVAIYCNNVCTDPCYSHLPQHLDASCTCMCRYFQVFQNYSEIISVNSFLCLLPVVVHTFNVKNLCFWSYNQVPKVFKAVVICMPEIHNQIVKILLNTHIYSQMHKITPRAGRTQNCLFVRFCLSDFLSWYKIRQTKCL
jgi:hypothetical protein